MSKSVMAMAYGGPDVLDYADLETPEPGPGQALVKVMAAGVNPWDYKQYSGAYGTDPARLPMRVGSEASGVVMALGGNPSPDETRINLGDEVVGYPLEGAYATEVIADLDSLLPKPLEYSFEEAGGLLLAGATAVHALTVSSPGTGDTLLVHGAAGGVGHMVVQLAVFGGVKVIGTAGPANHDYLREIGAEPVAYGDGLEERIRELSPGGVDAAIDTVGTDEAIDVSLALIPDRSKIVSIAAFERGAQAGIRLIGFGPGGDPGTAIRARARSQLIEVANAGKLRVRMHGSFPMSKAAEAHKLLASGHAMGKIVLVPD